MTANTSRCRCGLASSKKGFGTTAKYWGQSTNLYNEGFTARLKLLSPLFTSTIMFVYHKKNSPLLWLIFCECDIFSIANFSHFLKAMIHGQIIKHKKNSINQIRFKINKIHKYKLPISFLESESCILLFQAISLWRKPKWNLILEFQLVPFLCIPAPA